MDPYAALIRPVFFAIPPEPVHDLVVGSLGLLDLAPPVARALRGWTRADRPALRMRLAGVDFPNPIILAAGMDKDATALVGFFATGFGSVEVGTVTPRPQPGNPRPRLFRLPSHQALINRMGFNNAGMDAMAARLKALTWRPGPVGVNIGKNKDTPLEGATADYVACTRTLAPLADYVAVNLSSPNTPGLRALQEPKALEGLLTAVRAEMAGRPLFLKIAPDLGDEAVDAVVDVARSCGVDGLICTNTTITRPFQHALSAEAGGLSGRPLAARATEVIRRVFRRTGAALPIMGVGGIFSADDAWEKVCAGASAVQLYTGFIYGGPATVRQMLDGLEARLADAGLASLAQAVGRDS